MTELDVCVAEVGPTEPPGWGSYVRSRGLPAVWDWSLIRAKVDASAVPAFGITIRDGSTPIGVGAARVPSLRLRGRLVQGVLDVDCLLSASMPGLHVDGGAAGYEAALAGLRSAVRERFGRRINAMLLRQVPSALLAPAQRWSSIVREAPPIARFDNEFVDFDEYLGSLSKSRRKSLRRMMRRFEADDTVSCSFTATSEAVPDLDPRAACELSNAIVHRHHNLRWLPKRLMDPSVMAAILEHPDTDVVAYHEAGRLIAVGCLVGPGRMPLAQAWGALHHEQGGRRDLWFHHEMTYLRHVIDSGLGGFISGAGTFEPKRSLGLRLTPNWSVLQLLSDRSAPRYLDLARVGM